MTNNKTYPGSTIGSQYWSVLVLAIIVAVITSCRDTKDLSKPGSVVTIQEAPEWVNSRPHNSANYIGVGSASKLTQPLDYQAIAKKNALNDLASEISVRVQGSTFLNSMEAVSYTHLTLPTKRIV